MRLCPGTGQVIPILTEADPEVTRYMDDAARREGVAPDAMHGLTIGDLIFVRESKQNDVRVLREEFIHTEQQKGVAVGIGIDSRTSFEIDARKILLENAERWSLTPE